MGWVRGLTVPPGVIKSADLPTQECSWRVELASGRVQPAVAGGGFFLLPLLCCT